MIRVSILAQEQIRLSELILLVAMGPVLLVILFLQKQLP
jgi:hypothetical protein